jgi:hypothetical protein
MFSTKKAKKSYINFCQKLQKTPPIFTNSDQKKTFQRVFRLVTEKKNLLKRDYITLILLKL